jgi:hypothetical protein
MGSVYTFMTQNSLADNSHIPAISDTMTFGQVQTGPGPILNSV